jgi:hypothetical protein
MNSKANEALDRLDGVALRGEHVVVTTMLAAVDSLLAQEPAYILA